MFRNFTERERESFYRESTCKRNISVRSSSFSERRFQKLLISYFSLPRPPSLELNMDIEIRTERTEKRVVKSTQSKALLFQEGNLDKGLFSRSFIVIVTFQGKGYETRLSAPRNGAVSVYQKEPLPTGISLIVDKLGRKGLPSLCSVSPQPSRDVRSWISNACEENEVVITDIDYDVIEAMVGYLCTRDLELKDGAFGLALLAAADKYGILDLKDKCEEYVVQNLTNENAWNAMRMASLHRAQSLFTAAALIVATIPLDEFDTIPDW